ncbi:MAG: cytochrome c-type biogenesis protein CcmH [Acetobacteraceae bacterium]|nr:cytochrome c-type biogenesis protein CcmH [Acetobacteraceae bacterium]MCX7684135.1 cytochrome c-type biogenesis protein CcmH [Acetobacteraceae bacterium]MDW8399067.1 cytochrome c-type biogenesis protein [Acetobacteraceae bacterium]
MRRAALPAALAAALLLAPPGAGAVGNPADMLPDPAQEARARAIGRELRCLVCQNESIEDSNADLARDLRLLVRERIRAGDSDAEVIAFLRARYGDFVLLRPPFTAATAALWLSPALALAGGVLAIWLVRRRGGAAPAAPAPLSPEEQARLAALEGEARR